MKHMYVGGCEIWNICTGVGGGGGNSRGTHQACMLVVHYSCSHCNTLQHTAARCNTLWHTATHCDTLRHTTTHCDTLQHTTTHCNTLQHTAPHCNRDVTSYASCGRGGGGWSIIRKGNVKECVKEDEERSTLQHTATHCNMGREVLLWLLARVVEGQVVLVRASANLRVLEAV